MHVFQFTAAHQVFHRRQEVVWQGTGPQALAVCLGLLHLLSNVQEYMDYLR